MGDKIPDLPPACSKCIFVSRLADPLRCHRHAPSPGREENVPAHWPPVLPTGRCVQGSLGNDPENKRLHRCEGCGAWDHPTGGVQVQPYLMGDHSPEWWENTGYCLNRAPFPSGDDNPSEVHWLVTHMDSGCGDGVG
jgi:hypothetical protein